MSSLRVFTFDPDWGLPSTGPFALKLLAWLDLNGIDYEQVYEPDSRKGPRGKSPWIEFEGRRIGDSDVIIRLLADHFGKPVEQPYGDCATAAAAWAFKIAFEDAFHQILEWELFAHPAGFVYIEEQVRKAMPPILGAVMARVIRRHFLKQLHARGIARHDAATIAAKGREAVDRLAHWLGDKAFIAGDSPALADLAVFGQVAPMLHWPMRTPVADYVKTVSPVDGWCRRIEALAFAGRSVRVSAGARPASDRLREAAAFPGLPDAGAGAGH